MTDISFLTGGVVFDGGSATGNKTITLPATLQGGDVIWFCVGAYQTTYPTIVVSSTGTTPTIQGSPAQLTVSSTHGTGAIYKLVAAGTVGVASSDASKVVTFATSGSPSTAFWDITWGGYRNVDTANLPADTVPSPTVSSGSSANAPVVSSTAHDGEWALFMSANSTSSSSYSAKPGTQREANAGQGIFCDSNGSVGTAGSSTGGGTFTTSATSLWMIWTVTMVPLASADTGTAAVHMKKMGLAASGAESNITLRNNIDGITNGTTPTVGNSGGSSGQPFDAVSVGTGATNVSDNTNVGLGGQALKFATGSSAVSPYVQWGASLVSASKYYFWANCYFTANPAASIRPIGVIQTATLCASINVLTNGTIKINDASGTQMVLTTNSIPLNQKFRIEGYVVGHASAGQAEIKLFPSETSTTPTETKTSTASFNTTGPPNLIRYGIGAALANVTAFWMDDLGVSTAGYGYKVAGTTAIHMHKMGLAGTAKAPDVGTGSVRLKKMGLAGTAKETDAGTASIHIHKMHLAGTAVETLFGTGSVRLKKMGVSGSGTEVLRGTSAVHLHKMHLAASGSASAVGAGSVRLKKMGLAGTAKETDAGTGSVHLHKLKLSSSGSEALRGTGSVRLHKMDLSATAIETEFGTASVALHKMHISASGQETDSGTGSIRLKKMGIAGTAKAPDIGSGSVHLKKMGLAGVGFESSADAGTGSVHIHKMSLAVTAKETDAGIVAVHIHKMHVSGSGTAIGSLGAIQIPKMGLSGSGRGTTSGPLHISMKKMNLHGTGINRGSGSVHLHKIRVSATNKHGQASNLFIFTAV